MESLFGTQRALDSSPLTPAPEGERKSPGVAFALSLLFPGLGHWYCGKTRAAVLSALFFACAVLGAYFLPATNLFWGVSLRAALILYAYAFLDAFYTAREINAGMAPYIVGNNPRIAAMLNLLTTGFGYFYLGERKKGLICFVALRIFNSVIPREKSGERMLLSVAAEVILLIIAIDAYRLARAQLRETFPGSNLDPFAIATGMPAAAPIALASLFAFNYLALVTIGLAMPSYSPIDQSGAMLATSPKGTTYTNTRYKVGITAPVGWELDFKKPAGFVELKKHKGGCNVHFLAEPHNPIFGYEYFKHAILGENRNFHLLFDQPVELAGISGRKIGFRWR